MTTINLIYDMPIQIEVGWIPILPLLLIHLSNENLFGESYKGNMVIVDILWASFNLHCSLEKKKCLVC